MKPAMVCEHVAARRALAVVLGSPQRSGVLDCLLIRKVRWGDPGSFSGIDASPRFVAVGRRARYVVAKTNERRP